MRSAALLIAIILMLASGAQAAIRQPASLDPELGRFVNADGDPFTVKSSFYTQPQAQTTYIISNMDPDLWADDFAALGADGFNTISMIVPWGEIQESVQPDGQGQYEYLTDNLDRLEDMLDAAADAGIYVILSMGTVDRRPQGASGSDFVTAGTMSDPTDRAAFMDFAYTMSSRLAGHPALLALYLSMEAVSVNRWNLNAADPANVESFRDYLKQIDPSADAWLERWGEPLPQCGDPTGPDCWTWVAPPIWIDYEGSPWAFEPAWSKLEDWHAWHHRLLADFLAEFTQSVRVADPDIALGFLVRSNIMECDPNPDYDPAQDPDSDWRPYSDKSRGRRLPNPGDDPGIFCRDVIDDTQPLEALQGLGFDLALWAYFPHRNIEGVDGSRPAVEHQLAELQGIDEWVQEHTALPCFVEELGARSSRDLPDGGRGELRAAYAEALDLDNTVGAAIWTWRDDDHHSSSLNGNPTFRRLGADGAPIDYEIVGRPALMPIMSANAKGQPMPTQLALVDFSNHYIAYANAVPGKPLAIDVYTYGTDASGVTVLAELTWLDAQGEILGTFRHEWPGVDTSLNGLLTVTDPAPDGTSLALLSVRPEPGAAPLGLVMVSIKFSYADWGLRDLDSVPKPVLHDSQDEIDIRRINNLVK